MDVAQHSQVEIPVDAQQLVHDDLGVARVERRHRLIGEDDLGLLHQGAADSHPLLLTAGELVGALGGEVGDVEHVQG